MKLEVQAETGPPVAELRRLHRESLLAPLDDMWAAFAERARSHSLRMDGRLVGACSVDEDGGLRRFHLTPEAEARSSEIFATILDELEAGAAFPSTVDPLFLSLSLELGREVEAAALMYRHVLAPEGPALDGMRSATSADLEAAVAFSVAATNGNEDFTRPYLSGLVERGELLLHEEARGILAIGECRPDRHHAGHAHLGVIVGEEHRCRGLGGAVLHALVLEARRRGCEPLCSTEPGNLAARRAIERAGFRARHRVFRVSFVSRP